MYNNIPVITHIYFDWSETLAKPRMRETFLFGKTIDDKLSVLYDDVLYTLDYLTKKGYTLGIISNTSKNRKDIMNSLKETGLINYFKGAIALSSDKHLCKKGCKKIFEYCLEKDNISANKAVMVGNNYIKDVIGSKNVNMGSIFVDRKKLGIRGVEDLKINEISELVKYF